MNSTADKTAFHPYKVTGQGKTSLQLQPAIGQKTILIILRIMPLLMLAIGLIVYVTQKQILFLAIFGGIALLETLIFSFIKIPASLSMDSMGFTLETISMKGAKENYYLWSEVDYIRHRIVRGKNSTSLSYQAVLTTGKKISFLSFGNYFSKKNSIAEINALLHDISNKEVREK